MYARESILDIDSRRLQTELKNRRPMGAGFFIPRWQIAFRKD